MNAPAARWALSPRDYRAHAVSGLTGDSTMAARCGHVIPVEAGLDDEPRAQTCPRCVLVVAPTFEERGELVNAARDADGCGEWFPE